MLLLSLPVSAAGGKDATQRDLLSLVERLSTELDSRMQMGSYPETALRLLRVDCDLPDPSPLRARALRLAARDVAGDRGLELRGGYTSGPLEHSNDSGDASLELSWELLNEGYRESKLQAEQLEQRAQIAQIDGQFEAHRRNYRCRWARLSGLFSTLHGELLQAQLELLRPVFEIERRAYFLSWSLLDDYLVSEAELNATLDRLRALNSQPDHDAPSWLRSMPPPVTVDLELLLDSVRADPRSAEVTRLQQGLIASERQERRDKRRLRLFLRKEFDFEEPGDSDDLVAGVRFRVPLYRVSDESLAMRQQALELDHAGELWERIAQTKTRHVELQEQATRVIEQHYRYLRARERLRQTLVVGDLEGHAELVLMLTRLRSAQAAAIEHLGAVEELYQRVNEVFLAAGIAFDKAYLQPLFPQPGLERSRAGQRHVYIWSSTLARLNDRRLVAFLQAKAVSQVLLSASGQTDAERFASTARRLAAGGIATQPMVGGADWATDAKRERAVATAVVLAERYGGVHLDVEPHTLDDYRANSDQRLSEYIEMLEAIRAGILDRELSVSVPLHWPRPVYQRIAELADQVYLMAYEFKDLDQLQRRVGRLMPLFDQQQMVVALRIKDFENEWAMESTIDHLYSELGANTFALHPLGDYLRLSGRAQ